MSAALWCADDVKLSWLDEAIKELIRRGPASDCEDPSAFWEMVNECQQLHRNGLSALSRGEAPR